MRRDLTRQDRGSSGDLRWSALWGKTGRGKAAAQSSRGEVRSSALWGKGGRGALAIFTLAVAFGLVAPAAGVAGLSFMNSERFFMIGSSVVF